MTILGKFFTQSASVLAVAATPLLANAGTLPVPTTEQEIAMYDMSSSLTCNTHDGYPPIVMMIPSQVLQDTFGVRLGQADYNENAGYRTFIDSTVLPAASHLVRAFIAEHECAHHSLGHSWEAYDHGFIPTDRFWAYEDDADCEALNQIRKKYGYEGEETIRALFTELAQVLTQITQGLNLHTMEKEAMLADIPQRIEQRMNRALNCPIR